VAIGLAIGKRKKKLSMGSLPNFGWLLQKSTHIFSISKKVVKGQYSGLFVLGNFVWF